MSVPRASVLRPNDALVGDLDSFAARHDLARRSGEIDAHPAFPWTEFQAMGKEKLLGLHVPTSLGGRGLSIAETGRALHRLAYDSGTTFAKLSLQPEFSSVLADHGSPALVQSEFLALMRGERLIGNQITEPGAGSDARGITLQSRREGEEYVLSGTKSQAAFASEAHGAIVYARSSPEGAAVEITAFFVPQDQPGIHRTRIPDLGERWMGRGSVTYDGVRVPAKFRLGEEGKAFEYLAAELTRERALLAAIYLGVGRSSWEATVEHVGARIAFGRRLADQQAVSFPLAEDWARLDAAEGYVLRTLERLDAGERVEAEAALAKWMATEVALTCLDHAIQFHGGRGYSAELPFEQRWRDVRSGAIAHGPSEVMHLVAAHELWPREKGKPR